MSPGVRDDTISSELERTCAQEPIHLLGTVRAYGFLMVADLASRCIVQVSAGIVRHWPGLADAGALLGRPLAEWAAAVDASTLDLESLPTSHPVALPWRPRFEQTGVGPEQPVELEWECLGHRSGAYAVIEWLPVNASAEEMRRQNQVFADFGLIVARLRRAEGLDAFFGECVKVIQEISAFDRVMIYRFMPAGAARRRAPGDRAHRNPSERLIVGSSH